MSCRHFLPDIIDLARGEAVGPARETAALAHLRECPGCAACLEQQRAISAVLRRLASDRLTDAPLAGPGALLAAFDAVHASRRRAPAIGVRIPLAAAFVTAVVLALVVTRGSVTPPPVPGPATPPPAVSSARSPSRPSPGPQAAVISAKVQKHGRPTVSRRAGATREVTPFVVPPGANALPRFESGELIRIDVPDSMLPALGLWPRPLEAGAIQMDVLVGQDGLARAVRLVQ